MPKLVVVIKDGVLDEVLCDGQLPEGLRVYKADYDSDNEDEPCLGRDITEDVWSDVPDRVAEVLADLKKGADNAMPAPLAEAG